VQVYAPLAQLPLDDVYILAAPESSELEGLAAGVRAVIGRVDTAQLVSVRNAVTLEDIASDATSRYRFRAVLVMTFAALSLLLAMVGVFGVIAYSVQQRTREFGVRIALGASPATVLRLVFGGGARMIGAGAAIGLIGSVALARWISVFLFGVQPLDAVTLGLVVAGLAATAAVAILVPALRAMRVDPVEAFRAE
jgi:putative ABC transport system permease protein